MPIDFIRRLMSGQAGPAVSPEDGRLAVAALLVMAARADDHYHPQEQALIDQLVCDRYGLSPEQATQLRMKAEAAEADAVDLYQFTRAIREAIALEDRIFVIEALWRVILSDTLRDPHEDALMRQLADRLGLSSMDSALARRRVAGDQTG
jgi:uncharacterized tellurite resistance protein B-like protein